MIQFFVNNIEVVLPADFELTEIDENALITEAGEYTLDFEVSLLEPKNARIFGHANRPNTANKRTDYDNARKVVNGRVSQGRLIVVQRTDTNIKLQFVAGSSNVNYQLKDDRKIWELDFGTENEITFELAMRSIKYPGYGHKRIVQPPLNWVVEWDNYYACVPVKFNNLTANYYRMPKLLRGGDRNGHNMTYWAEGDGGQAMTADGEMIIQGVQNIVMQPYLLYYINKLPELLGFELKTNVLNSDFKLQKKILINRVRSLKYSDALPDMTIREFISAVEYTYNVVFNFKNDNTIDILSTKYFVDNKSVIAPTVLDQFIEEPAEDVYRFDVNALSYELGNGPLAKYQKLDESIVEKCTKIEFSNIVNLKLFLHNEIINNFKLYEIIGKQEQYLFTDNPKENLYRQLPGTTKGVLIGVNKFRSYKEDGNKEIELKIVPCAVICDVLKYRLENWIGGGFTYADVPTHIQIASVATELFELESQNVLEALESALTQIPRSSVIEVVLYNGMVRSFECDLSQTDADGKTTRAYFKYPFSFVDSLPEYWLDPKNNTFITAVTQAGVVVDIAAYAASFETWITTFYKPVCNDTLKITGSADAMWEKYYTNRNSYIDTTVIYTRYFPPKQLLSSKYIYYIDGNEYIPISIERKISADGSEKEIVGKFYRLK